MYKRMLVPLDGSQLAEVVLGYAREIAARLDMDVVLFHVSNPKEGELTPMHRAYMEQATDMVRQRLEDGRQGATLSAVGSKVEVRWEAATGQPAEEILDYADRHDVDFIMMATHGRSGITRWALGSVADKVLRASPVPVWLVRAGIPDEIVYDRWPSRAILVPLDGSELAQAVLPHVETLAKQRGIDLVDVVLLAVCEPTEPPRLYPASPVDWEADLARSKESYELYLATVEMRLKQAGLTVRSEVLIGKPAEQIIEYANRDPFNLIVMATHGRSGISRWMFGSIAEKVLLGASSPIFLVRPKSPEQ